MSRYPVSMLLRWPDGAEGLSEHLNARLLVQYLLDLHRLGDDVTVLWIRAGARGWPS